MTNTIIKIILVALLTGCASKEAPSQHWRLDDAYQMVQELNGFDETEAAQLHVLLRTFGEFDSLQGAWQSELKLSRFYSHSDVDKAKEFATASLNTAEQIGGEFEQAESNFQLYRITNKKHYLDRALMLSNDEFQRIKLNVYAGVSQRFPNDEIVGQYPPLKKALIYYWRGKSKQNISDIDRAIELFRLVGAKHSLADALFYSAQLHFEQGNTKDAKRKAMRAHRVLKAVKSHSKVSAIDTWLRTNELNR